MHLFHTVLEGFSQETLNFAAYLVEAMAHRTVDGTDMESPDIPQADEAIAAARRLMDEQEVAFDNHYSVESRRIVIRNDEETGCAREAARFIQVLLNHAKDDRWVPIEYG